MSGLAWIAAGDDQLAAALGDALGRDGWSVRRIPLGIEPTELDPDGAQPAVLVVAPDAAADIASTARLARAAADPMRRGGYGRIVYVAPPLDLGTAALAVHPADHDPNGDAAARAGARGALVAVARSLALEEAPGGVTVNAVLPGVIEQPLDSDRDVRNAFPARRTGTRAEVAECVRFLASPDAGYVTGIALPVDGGLSA